MRTTVIPAQVTTVEDKITGNLNLTQILLLLSPVLWSTVIYILFYPHMKFTWIKVPIMGIISAVSLILAIRIRGKVMIEWLIIIARYNARPAYWIFNKNDVEGRVIDEPHLPKESASTVVNQKKEAVKNIPQFTITDLVQFNHLLTSLNVRYRTTKKGGLRVAFNEIAK